MNENPNIEHPASRALNISIRAAFLLLLLTCTALPLYVFGQPGGLRSDEKPALGPKLRSGSAAERRETAEAVLHGRGHAADGELAQALSAEPDPETKVRLIRALGGRGSDEAVAALTDTLLRDSSPLARATAAKQLRRLQGGKTASDALAQALKNDKDADVRSACASALGAYRIPEAVKALADAAKDKDPKIRRHAALGLTRQPKTAETEAALGALEKDADPGVAAKTRAWRGQPAPAKAPAQAKSGKKKG